MTVEKIIFHSAGSLSVAVLALVMFIIQLVFILKNAKFRLYGWSAGISFSAMLYAIGIFFEYNTLPGRLNQWAGRLEWTALILLIHQIYGFIFCYFQVNGKRYHQIAGFFHLMLIFLLWFSNLLVSDQFVTRNLSALSQPFIEAALGPFGIWFVIYGVLSSLAAIALSFRFKDPGYRYKAPFLLGISLWALLGIHDGLAALGMTTYMYLMEYGFFIFAVITLWIVFSRFYEKVSEDKYRTIAEFLNDGILVVQNGKTVFENPACRTLIGQSVIGWTVDDFTSLLIDKDKKIFTRFYYSLMNSEDQNGSATVRINRGNENQSVVEINANTIEYTAEHAVLAVLRDVTERIRKEKSLKESEEKIARLKNMESLGLLAGGVAHDLNNVLSGIVSYPDLILMELPENSHLRGPIMTIKQSGRRASAIVGELLTVARGAAVEKKVMNLNRVIEAYLNSPEHEKLKTFHPHVQITANLDPQLLNIKGSPMHFGKLVMNLVSNATESIEDTGMVFISTTNRLLKRPLQGYTTIPEGEYVVLAVKDNGPGIGTEGLNRIFEPFYTKKVMGRSGTGLGLTLVWNVVENHGGHINVISDNSGTCFEIYLKSSRERLEEKALSSTVQNLVGHGEHILVVDDVKSQREITCQMLEKLGYKSHSVSCGEAAIDYIKDHGGVDLLLLDMIMAPGISGRETYEKIKVIHPDQKAIILSGFAETEDVRKAIKAGAAKYIRKPVLIDELGQAIKEAFD